jgi:hypothetical protein
VLVGVIARSGENLKGHDSGCCERLVALERRGQTAIGGTARSSLKLDPCRAVDEDHSAER